MPTKEPEGRIESSYFPLLPAVFWVALKYAPRALPGKFGPALFRMQAAGLVAYTIAGAIFAFPTLAARYYAHGRDIANIDVDLGICFYLQRFRG